MASRNRDTRTGPPSKMGAKKEQSMMEKIKNLFFKDKKKTQEKTYRRNVAIVASSLWMAPTTLSPYPEWRRKPSMLKPYFQPIVMKHVRSLPPKASGNVHFIPTLKLETDDERLNSLSNTPSTAACYIELLPAIFKPKIVEQISGHRDQIERRIHDLARARGRSTWWDLMEQDINTVLGQVPREYFEREEASFFLVKNLRRCRLAGMPDRFRYRDVKKEYEGMHPWRRRMWLGKEFPTAKTEEQLPAKETKSTSHQDSDHNTV